MALAVALLGSVTFNTTAGSKTVTATPAANDLIVVITAHSGNTSTSATPPTDNNSDGRGTYALVTSALKASSADVMCVWVRKYKVGSATSTVFTHAPGTTTGGGLAVIKVTGMTLAGLLAALHAGASANQASGGTPSVALGAAANTNNAVIGAVFSATNSTTTVATNASYTERFDNGYATPTSGLEIMTRDSGETGSSIGWGGTIASAFCAVAIELDARVPAAAATLTDNFDDNSRDTAKWNIGTLKGSSAGGTITETNQRLEILPPGSTGYTGYLSVDNYDLTGSSIYCKITPSTTLDAVEEVDLVVGTDSSNYYLAAIGSANIFFQKNIAGSAANIAAPAYNSTTHAWFRLRESGGTIFMDVAGTGASDPPVSGDWTNIGSEVAAINLSSVKVSLQAGVFGGAAPVTVYFDGFNTGTSGASVGSASGTGSATAVPIVSGAASGTGTASGVGRSTAVATGSASGTGSATGGGVGLNVAAGSSNGAGSATAVGRSTASSPGSASGIGAASAVGASTASSPGAAAGIGATTAAGSSQAVSAGASSGTGVASGSGLSTAAALGAAAGVGSQTGVGSSTARSAGAAAGLGSATGVSSTAGAPSVGAASGTGSAAAVGQSTAVMAGSASGTGAATSAGSATASGQGASAGLGAASATGSALSRAAGASAGAGVASAVGSSTAISNGASSGAAAANANGTGLFNGVGSSSGSSSATGIGSAYSTGVGLSAGFGVAVGEGSSIARATGLSSGSGEAAAVGSSSVLHPPVTTPADRRASGSIEDRSASGSRAPRSTAGIANDRTTAGEPPASRIIAPNLQPRRATG